MPNKQIVVADNTAVRTALWRALHVELDSSPHVFEDIVGLKLVDPDSWMAQSSGHESVYAPLPRLHFGSRPFR